MQKKSLLTVLLSCTLMCMQLKATFMSMLEVELGNFSLCLFVLEKNVMRLERYGLHELVQNPVVVTKKSSNEHCSHVMHLGERGQRVAAIMRDSDCLRHLQVKTYRGKKEIEYRFDWAKLMLLNPEQVDALMCAEVKITHNAMPESEEMERARHEDKAPMCRMSVSWGLETKHVMHLDCERNVEHAVAFVVPNCMCKDAESMRMLKKADLLAEGLLTRLEAPMPMHQAAASSESHDEMHDMMRHVKRNRPCSHSVPNLCSHDEEELGSQNGSSSFSSCPIVNGLGYLYTKTVGAISYLVNCECC